ncbi:unnamed protein product [Camellia sinensis]
MCRIDDEDEFVIGASAKFDFALLSDDFNKSFNPMSEPDDNWACKSDDTPELESRVNVLSGQTVNKATDIPRASGKGNNDFTFPCGPSVAEDDDDDNEVIESKIRAFLDEKVLSLPLKFSVLVMEALGRLLSRVVHGGLLQGLEVDYSGSGHCDDDMCQIDDEDDFVIGVSTKFDSALLSDDFNKINKSADIPRASGKGTSFCERKRIWEEELYEELERKREHKQQEVCGLENSVSTAYGSWEEITIWVSSISFHAYAGITFQSTSDGGKGDYRSEICSPVSIVSKGEILQENATNAHNSDSNSYLKTDCSDLEVLFNAFAGDKRNVGRRGRTWVEVIRNDMTIVNLTKNVIVNGANGRKLIHVAGPNVIRVVVGTMPVGHLYSRLVPLVLILVDGSNPIDIIDPRCKILLIVQKKIDLQGGNQLRLLGFAAIYRFYHYPDSLRLRLSQLERCGFSKLEPLNALENDVHVPKTKGKEHRHKSKVQDDKNGTISLPVPVKRRRLRVVDKKMQLGGYVPRHRLCLKCLDPNSIEENVQFGCHWLPQNTRRRCSLATDICMLLEDKVHEW